MNKTRTDFQKDLERELKNPTFKKYYDEHGRQLEIAYQMLQLRKQKKLSQTQLAKQLGTTQSNIARMEAGIQNFSLTTLDKLAQVFNKKLEVRFS